MSAIVLFVRARSMMSASRVRLLAGAIVVGAVAIILAVAWPHIREYVLLRRYAQTAREAYVAIYRPEPACYRLDRDGVDVLARIIREDTAADPLPKRATLVLVEVVFVGDDGSPGLYCSLHSLPGPKTAKTIEERMDYWEQMVANINTAAKVPCEAIEDVLEEKPLYSFRRRSGPAKLFVSRRQGT